MISPFADLTFSGASLELRKLADPYITRELLESMATDYLGGADPADPRCSSVFADLHDLPPLLIQVGDAVPLVSNVLLAAAKARLRVLPCAPRRQLNRGQGGSSAPGRRESERWRLRPLPRLCTPNWQAT